MRPVAPPLTADPNPAGAQALWHRAEQLLAHGDSATAREVLEALLLQQPGHVMARLRLSTLATAAGHYRESVEHLLAAARLQPAEPELLLLLAAMLHRLGESAAALECLAQPSWESLREIELLEQAANLALQMEAMELAESMLDRARRQAPPRPSALYAQATVETFRGQLPAAEASLQALIARQPGHAQAHWSLARLRRQSAASQHVDRLRALLARGPDPRSAAYLGFALFKELDDLDRNDEAWAALTAACKLKRASLAYDAQAEAAAFTAVESLPLSEAAPPESLPGPRPIFIVGMPRTGTTLLESILGRHEQVQHAGELDDLPLQLRWCADRFSKRLMDAQVYRSAANCNAAELGARYLQHAAWRARGKPVFTDKLPLNFMHVGFIAQALPQARILHMTRNPMDTCFSNLKELFADAYGYSYDFDELAAHYGRYRRLMQHWHALLPGRILDVAYEDLVAEPAETGRRVLEFCALDWHEDLLAPDRSESVVTTASSVQVRQPIHRAGVAAWMRYQQPLEPLRQRLQADGWVAP